MFSRFQIVAVLAFVFVAAFVQSAEHGSPLVKRQVNAGFAGKPNAYGTNAYNAYNRQGLNQFNPYNPPPCNPYGYGNPLGYNGYNGNPYDPTNPAAGLNNPLGAAAAI